MLVLGIETSCDETAAAVVDDGRRILAQSVRGQNAEHGRFGGIVPEVAARAHVEVLDGLIARSLAEAGIGLAEIDAVAATAGPGLIGGVMVGLVTAKALAAAAGRKLIAVNHLEGHALSARLSDDVAFPYLLLLVSGGHCQLLEVQGVGRYRRLGGTIDDAAGECFDKGARLLGLGYPGGPAIERAALAGDPRRFALPRPLKGRPGCDFSFSGLKTALRHAVAGLGRAPAPAETANLAAALQAAIVEVMVDRVRQATRLAPAARTLVVAGGVAANRALRAALAETARASGLGFVAPPVSLCTDNAAMIAWAGIERLRLGLVDRLDVPARARWPLDELAA
ncbi:MAG: tRNA (adenosine(37)-N6)-threonylcarbamoyltransferase complex transferase subunit TsaD [Alphaproteobacteria bacterium]|nr:tRNA (adenosine(37)-N6)-threonylcarbamoyltransferase complex transferase subunit TsaD [Alphaproteobacteria bacterium]